MIPKVTCCLSAVKDGVQATHIIDGRRPHALLEALGGHFVGSIAAGAVLDRERQAGHDHQRPDAGSVMGIYIGIRILGSI